MHDQYIFSGSLPEDASSYVKRQADDELYEALLQGKFCYVLNSRQSGKSSLRVRTMSRLSKTGVECAAIDLSSISIQTATEENWYADLIVKLIDSFVLDIDFKSWWEQNQLNSPLLRFGNFITKVLLSKITEKIVIFIDEIDSVLSLNFPTDDFFAFIRSCYNSRIDDPKYNRLTFCLLGVASPTSLIKDKKRTPFNIGQAILLKGFHLDEVKPLKNGLSNRFSNSQTIMREILQWTGGQPFLTQKLCQFILEEPEEDNYRSVAEVVKARIIDNWEAQDDPEHLRTIRTRILKNNACTVKMIELYIEILKEKEVIANNKPEEIELQLSGLVVKQKSNLRIYNPIYEQIFNIDWAKKEQNKLRPYAEKLSAWLRSSCQDQLSLLHGKTLEEALEWAEGRSLSVQDYQFLAASQKKERDKAERQAQNKLTVLRRSAKKWISIACAIVLISIITAIVAGFIGHQNLRQAQQATTFEQLGLTALREFKESQLESLLLAMKAGQGLKKLPGKSKDLEKYPTVTPLLALQTILEDPSFRQINEFIPGQEGINSLRWFNDDTQIATAGKDGTVQLTYLNPKQADQNKKFLAHQSEIRVIDFLLEKNQTFFATGDKDSVLKVWNNVKSINPEKPQPLSLINTKQGGINHVIYLSNNQVVTSGEDGTVKLWNLSGNKLSKIPDEVIQAHQNCHLKENNITCDDHQPSIKSLNRSDDNKRLVSGGDDKLAYLWEIDGNTIKEIARFIGHKARINSANFSPKCKLTYSECKIATADADGIVKIWNPSRPNKELLEFKADQESIEVVRFSPKEDANANILATASKDGIISLWKISKDQSAINKVEHLADFQGHQGSIVSFRFTKDGKQLATAGKDDGTVKLWKIDKEPTYLKLEGHNKPIYSVRFSPDDSEVATASDDGTVKLWKIDKQHLKRLEKPEILEKHPSNIQIKSVRFSPNGQQIVTAGSDSTIRLWTRGQKEPTTEIKTDQRSIWSINFNKDGDLLASAGSEEKGTVKLWKTNGEMPYDPFALGAKVEAVRFSEDGNFLAAVGEKGEAKIWSLDRGRKTIKLEGKEVYKGTIFGLSFINNDQEVITAGDDGIIRRWKLSGDPLQEIKTYQSSVKNISLSETQDAKNRIVATVGRNGTVRLWALSGQLSGELLADFKGHQGIVRSVSFSKDRKYLVTAGDDGTAIVWSIKGLDELLDEGCNWLKDYLSTHEKEQDERDVRESCQGHSLK